MPLVETFRGVVYPWLCDHMGHLTVPRYFEMFDVAAYHLYHVLGEPTPGDGQFGLADVRHEIDYRHEARVGALLLIRSGVVATGRSSLRARHVMMDPDGQVVHAVLESTTVRLDLVARKSAPLTPAFTTRAADFLIENTEDQ